MKIDMTNLNSLSFDELQSRLDEAVTYAESKREERKKHKLREEAAARIEAVIQELGGDEELEALVRAIRSGEQEPPKEDQETPPSVELEDLSREPEQCSPKATHEEATQVVPVRVQLKGPEPDVRLRNAVDRAQQLVDELTDDPRDMSTELSLLIEAEVANLRAAIDECESAGLYTPALMTDVRNTMGGFTRLAREHLQDAGIYVYGLSTKHQTNWRQQEQDAKQRLQRFYAQREAEERQEEERKEAERLAKRTFRQIEECLGQKKKEDLLVTLVRQYMNYGQAADIAPLVEPKAHLFKAAEFRALRRQFNRNEEPEPPVNEPQVEPEEEEESANHPEVVERNLGVMKGKRGIIFGGASRPAQQAKIKETLGFESLDWEVTESGATRSNVPSIGKIKNGKYDVVIVLLQFISHDISHALHEAAEAGGATFLSIRRGYGVTQICLELERVSSTPTAQGV